MIDNLEYNTERTKLIIPEYGRHIHKMIDHALSSNDIKDRNKVAKAIIGVMGNLNPHLRDVPDFQHKLWDQLFIMSDFNLDVDSPFPKPVKEVYSQRPEKLNYPQSFPKYRFYGNNIKRMIDVAIEWEDNEMKKQLVYVIANHMKKCFLNWNKDTVEDDVIFNHLDELSDGKLKIDPSLKPLSESQSLIKLTNKKFTKNNSKNKKPYRSFKKRNNN
ncbi:MAG: methionyl-tRNA formyltransferase [Flavobacteriales bacterium]|nr:methionyl-tRNA formyltransferase [Flavobacteriales bacterium]